MYDPDRNRPDPDRATPDRTEPEFDLFNQPRADDEADATLTASERFERFHAAHGHVYDAIVRLARRWRSATGRDQQGVKRLIEIARWDEGIRTGEEPEINNSHAPYYARLIMLRESDLAEAFEIRRAAEPDAWIAALAATEGRTD